MSDMPELWNIYPQEVEPVPEREIHVTNNKVRETEPSKIFDNRQGIKEFGIFLAGFCLDSSLCLLSFLLEW